METVPAVLDGLRIGQLVAAHESHCSNIGFRARSLEGGHCDVTQVDGQEPLDHIEVLYVSFKSADDLLLLHDLFLLFSIAFKHAAERELSSLKLINCFLYVTDIFDGSVLLLGDVFLCVDCGDQSVQCHNFSLYPVVDVSERIPLVSCHYFQFLFEACITLSGN